MDESKKSHQCQQSNVWRRPFPNKIQSLTYSKTYQWILGGLFERIGVTTRFPFSFRRFRNAWATFCLQKYQRKKLVREEHQAESKQHLLLDLPCRVIIDFFPRSCIISFQKASKLVLDQSYNDSTYRSLLYSGAPFKSVCIIINDLMKTKITDMP